MEQTQTRGSGPAGRSLFAAVVVCLAVAVSGGVGLYGMGKMSRLAESGRAQASQAASIEGAQRAWAGYEAAHTELQQTYRNMRIGGIALICASILLAFVMVRYAARSVTEPLKRLHDVLRRLSEGDLTVSIEVDRASNDDVAVAVALLETTVRRLRDSLQRVAETADVVYRGSQELSAASEQMSASAQAQASSLEETAASMEEMTSTVKHNADNALQVDKLAAESAEAANESVTMAASLQRSMNLINGSSNKIADIIGVIDDIAFQTNLLALNAAVEAARAGEHGRGFAVVATEVRSLAQRSAQAAKEIKALISDSVEKVGDGAHLVGITSSKLESIVGKVKSVAELVSEINASSQEQASGIEQVNRAIVHMDGATQATAAQAEELTGTSQSLSTQAEHLRQLVGQFKLPGSVSRGAFTPTPATARPAATTTTPKRAPAESTKPGPAGDAKKVEKLQAFRPRKAAGASDDWTEF